MIKQEKGGSAEHVREYIHTVHPNLNCKKEFAFRVMKKSSGKYLIEATIWINRKSSVQMKTCL